MSMKVIPLKSLHKSLTSKSKSSHKSFVFHGVKVQVLKAVTHLWPPSWWWHLIFPIERTRWGLPGPFLPLWSHKSVLLLLLLLSCSLARDISTALLSPCLWSRKLTCSLQFNNETEPVFISSVFRKIKAKGGHLNSTTPQQCRRLKFPSCSFSSWVSLKQCMLGSLTSQQ